MLRRLRHKGQCEDPLWD